VSFAVNIPYFKDEAGKTNWQYIANWSSGILILLLSITAIILYFSRKQVNSSNKALKQINDELEQRVQERTATLDESNRLLTESNHLLGKEIEQHLATTKNLHVSETYIKSILESMPLMLVGLDRDGVVTHWNKGAEKITGLAADKALDKMLWEAYPIMPVSQDKVTQALEENQALHLRRSQRGQLHFEIIIYPLSGSDESTESRTGAVIMVDDVTKQVHSENKLIEKDKLSTMGELAATMARDINQPLKYITADLEKSLDLARRYESTSENRDLSILLEDAAKESQRASAITTNLIDFGRSHEREQQSADVIEIMNNALDLAADIFALTDGFRFSEIEIVKDYESKVPPINCFVSELQQVFLSLLRHSCYALSKATRKDQAPKITIKVIECYEAVWVKIQHNGKGLNIDEQQVIFEPYFSNEPLLNPEVQYDASKHLSFSHFIVTEHHQGQMAVTSGVDVGTTFHMEFPLR
jgi:PAS domain S-box-containing protein